MNHEKSVVHGVHRAPSRRSATASEAVLVGMAFAFTGWLVTRGYTLPVSVCAALLVVPVVVSVTRADLSAVRRLLDPNRQV